VRAWLVVLLLTPLISRADGVKVSLNGTVAGRWVDALRVSADHQSATLDGGGVAFGGSLDVSTRLSRFHFGAQLAAEALQAPNDDVEVRRSQPLARAAVSNDPVTAAMFLTVAPFAGLTFGDEQTFGWLDLMLGLELTSAKVDGTRLYGFTPVPTLRLGGAIELGGFGFELSLLGSFLGAPRVALAMGIRL
jgi:hypothetical protein